MNAILSVSAETITEITVYHSAGQRQILEKKSYRVLLHCMCAMYVCFYFIYTIKDDIKINANFIQFRYFYFLLIPLMGACLIFQTPTNTLCHPINSSTRQLSTTN